MEPRVAEDEKGRELLLSLACQVCDTVACCLTVCLICNACPQLPASPSLHGCVGTRETNENRDDLLKDLSFLKAMRARSTINTFLRKQTTRLFNDALPGLDKTGELDSLDDAVICGKGNIL